MIVQWLPSVEVKLTVREKRLWEIFNGQRAYHTFNICSLTFFRKFLSHTNNLQSTHFSPLDTAHIPFMPLFVSIQLSCHTHKCNKPLAVSHKSNIKVFFMWWARAIEATKNCQFIILPAMAIFHILLFSSFLCVFLYTYSSPSPFRDSSHICMHTRRGERY